LNNFSKLDLEKGKRLSLIFILILMSLNLAVYLPSLEGDFVWDDSYFISENPHLLGANFLKKFMFMPFGGVSGEDENSRYLDRILQFYRPFTSLSYWIDYKLWGLNPAGFHLTNIIIHILNCFVLYFVLLKLGLRREISFLASLLHSVFPLHFENVSWISGRTDLLSFLCIGISTLFFLKFLRNEKWLFLAMSSIFYFSSLLCKENVILFPLLYLLIYLRQKVSVKGSLFLSLPFLTFFFIWFVFRRVALGSLSIEYSGRSIWDFLSTSGFYVFKTFFPYNLSVSVDSYRIFKSIPLRILGIISFLLFLYVAVKLMMKVRGEPAKLVYFSYFLLLLPATILIFSGLTLSFVSWRFMYLPSALFVSYLVSFIFRKIKGKIIALSLIILIFFTYVLEIYPKNRLFGKEEAEFWLSIEDVEKEDLIFKFNIAQKNLIHDENKALQMFNEILSNQKKHHLYDLFKIKIYEELASHYTFKREFEKAEEYFSYLAKMPKSQYSYFIYAYFLLFQGKIQEGERIVSGMLELFPENYLVLLHAARFYNLKKDYQKSIELLEKNYVLFPNKKVLRLIEEMKRHEKDKIE